MALEIDRSVINLTRTVLSEILDDRSAPTKFGPSAPSFAQEDLVAGVPLANYQTRTPNDEGTHVVIVKHEEKVEAIPQPPTAEELAAAREERKFRLKLAGGIVAAIAAAVGGSAIFATRKPRIEYLPRPTMAEVETEV